ncbi:MAG: hypothetical protein LBE92_02370 [Chryseobacterium sp.]|jgi:hypothetical protein|uniref:DUF6882 domain-containing protein n=1 Tax=Chryseobacterium sp. TaxID=1871047 RepID=UPI0028334AC5|nr:DUF6882 domain-containing protein [Chryseobacterium sp.]MDR2234945.1 hypothetical protein [Chryseobacterium sp.]
MGLFNKIFGQSDQQKPETNQQQQPEQKPCKTEQELLEHYGGIALDKQMDFGEVIGDNNWNVNIQQGTISFGEDLVFPIQVLGTFSHSSQTWLWAWANTQSGLPESIMQQALQLKKYGEENGIDLLSSNTFDFSADELHLMGMIASGMFNASGYYIADYGQGAMVVTMKSDVIDKARNTDHIRVLTAFPQLISQFDMDHKNAFKSYLTFKGYQVTEKENSIEGTKDGNSVTGEFDDLSRLINLKG